MFLVPFIIFISLLPVNMNFKFNFRLHVNIISLFYLRVRWKLLTILKTSKKSMKQRFWCEQVYIFSKFLQYTMHWGKTQMLKKFPSDKRNDKRNLLLFLSRAQTHHSCTFITQSLYELKHKVRRSKSVSGIFYFKFRFIFIKAYIFVREKALTL